MSDREKVIDGLIMLKRFLPSTMWEPINDAIGMLKEQEAVEPYQHDAVWLCGNCEKEVVGWDDDIDGKEYRYPFCRRCGQAVKWE